jgi:hypothetical protein
MADRIEELIGVGDAADLPAANGAGRFFYEQDTDILKFDDGTWHPIGGSGLLGDYLPLSAGASYPLTGDLYLGTNINIRLKNSAALMGADSGGGYLDIMYITGLDECFMGNTSAELVLLGSETRPRYDDPYGGPEDLALFSDLHAESHDIASHSDTTATGTELETLTDGSNADSLHSHAGVGHTIASHSDTTATGAELETLTNGSDAGALHIHDARYYTESQVNGLLHPQSHNIASHNDTTATGTELETLTDGSNADALHTHAGGAYLPLSAGVGEPLTGDLYLTNKDIYCNSEYGLKGKSASTYYYLARVDASNRSSFGNSTLNTIVRGSVVRLRGILAQISSPGTGDYAAGEWGLYYDTGLGRMYLVTNRGGNILKVELT